MKRCLALATIWFSAIIAGAENPPPAFWDCTFYRMVSSEQGGSQQSSIERLELKPATEIARQFPEGSVRGFVCNSEPVSEIDFWIEDTHGNRLTLSTNHVDGGGAGLYSTAYQQNGSNVTLGVSCGAPK